MFLRSGGVLIGLLILILVGGCLAPPPPPAPEGGGRVEPAPAGRPEPEPREPEPVREEPAAAPEPEPPRMSIAPAQISPGDFFWVYVRGVDGGEVEIYFREEAQPVYPLLDGAGALVGVSYHVPPGRYEVKAAVGRGEEAAEISRAVQVVERDWEVQHLWVTEEQQSQRSAELWEEDRPHMIRSRAETAPHPLWTEDFVWPVQGRITTEFGVIRYVNERESGRHSGLDIAAPTGTPVLAANCGRVTLSRDLNVPGRTIVIDHGVNLFTVYYHLEERIAREGDRIERGEVIGEVGSTGFSTGPHLHLTFSVGEVPVDPWSFLEADPLEAAREAARQWDERTAPVPAP